MSEEKNEALETFAADDALEQEIASEVEADEPMLVAAQDDDDVIAERLSSLRAEEAPTAADDATVVMPAVKQAQPDADGAFLEGDSAQDFADVAPKKHTGRTVFLIILAVLLIAIAGVCGWVYYVEKQAEGIVPTGVTLAQGTELGGMDEAAVRKTIETRAKKILNNNVIVASSANEGDSLEANSVSKPISTFVALDTEKMVKDALDVRQNASLITRLKVDILNDSIAHDISYSFTIDEDALKTYVKEVAAANDQKALDATLKQEAGHITVSDSKTGFKTDKDALTAALKSALEDSMKKADESQEISVDLTGKTTEPKKTADSLKSTPAIIVTLSKRQVALYNGEHLVKTYRCAIGTPDHPTPVGNWKIVLKRKNPTWVNPGSAWATSMPKTIPPGPTNPLGLRALNLNASGIRLHGTTSLSSIGTAASHGCMRMRNQDIVDLFDRVKVGTPVFIIP